MKPRLKLSFKQYAVMAGAGVVTMVALDFITGDRELWKPRFPGMILRSLLGFLPGFAYAMTIHRKFYRNQDLPKKHQWITAILLMAGFFFMSAYEESEHPDLYGNPNPRSP